MMLLAVLGVVLTPLFWPLGALLVWVSPYWTKGEKWLATLVWPGGLPLVFNLLTFVPNRLGYTISCSGHVLNGRPVVDSCNPPLLAQTALYWLGAIVLAAPLIVTLYMAYRLIQRRQRFSGAEA